MAVRQLAGAGESSSNNHDGGANDMTNVTSDIEHWYEMNAPEDQQGKDDLIQSVETVATVGDYTTEEKHGQLFVSGWSDDKLRLANDKARARFLRYVREGKVLDDTELDFQRAMEDSKS
jgi:hypothetical protein